MTTQEDLDSRGYAPLGKLLADDQCKALVQQFALDEPFRSHIVMQRHGFGQGEYKYFSYPLPEIVAKLREQLYQVLMPVANDWNKRMRIATRFPNQHDQFLARCHKAGQTRPTPLMLNYASGDYNCLHQDLYGDHVFPLQVVILLTESRGFSGGEFVLTEQRPRMQSRVEVVPLRRGYGVAFAVNERPKQGVRGDYRVKMRHGVSEIRSGARKTLGIIFHDAK